jgi:hypothetical protein
MKTKKLYFLVLLFFVSDIAEKKSLFAAPTAQTPSTQSSVQKNQNDMQKEQAQAADIIFAPDMPINSIYEKMIDQIYGSAGLNIPAKYLTHIKNSYCYLEFLVKIDQVKNNTKYAQYQTTDFKDFINPRADNKALMPTQTLVQSAGWQAVEITAQDLRTSTAWQNFIKAMICDSLDNDATFIIDTTQTNNQIFPYIPNIETSYQTDEFTSLRLYQESIQLQALLQGQQRKKYIAQTIDWASSGKIQDNITQFKKSGFYNFTHNAQAAKPKTDPKTGAQIPVVIASPVREQIVCYYMFMHIQTIVNDIITLDNAAQFLTQANSTQLTPNFFMYNPSDYVTVCDMLQLQKLSDDHKKNPKKSEIVMTQGTNETPAASPSKPTTSTIPKNSEIKNLPVKNVSPATPAPSTPAANSVTSAEQTLESSQKQISTIIFQKLPTNSAYETVIDKIYGSAGLHLAQEQIEHIKKTYCYLEFLVKIDKVKNDPKYKQYQTTEFKDFMTSQPGDGAYMPTQTLVTSPAWKAIQYTDKDMTTSSAWQMFIKSMICDIYNTHDEFILDSLVINNQIIDDIADIENYYTSDEFTKVRLTNENMQLHQVMLENQQKIYLEQCADWKKLNQKDLITAIEQFKQTDFYNFSHNPPTTKTQDQAQKQYTSIASPTKEQLVSYYTLLTIQTEVYNLLTLENLLSFLTTASSSELSPNFFAYSPSDFIYFYDNLTLSDLIDDNNEAVKNIAIDQDDDTDEQDDDDDEVVIQSAANDLKKMNRASAKSLKKMNRASAKSLKKMDEGTRKSLRKMNRATRKNIKKTNRISAKRWEANKKLLLPIIIAIAVVIAVVAIVLTLGAAAPMVMAGWTLASAAFASGSATGGTLGGIAAVGALAATSAAAVVIPTTVTGVVIAGTVVAGVTAVGIAATVDKKFKNDLMKNFLMPMMQGMEVMTDAFTTGIIQISVGLTFTGALIGQGLGYPVNPKLEMHKVKAKMEKYRSTINIVSSILVTIIITVAMMAVTAGVGMVWAAAARSGWLGAEAMATTLQADTIALNAAKVSADSALKTALSGGDELAIASARSSVQKATAALEQGTLKAVAARQAVTEAFMGTATLGETVVNPMLITEAAATATTTVATTGTAASTAGVTTGTSTAFAAANIDSANTALTSGKQAIGLVDDSINPMLTKQAVTNSQKTVIKQTADDSMNPMLNNKTILKAQKTPSKNMTEQPDYKLTGKTRLDNKIAESTAQQKAEALEYIEKQNAANAKSTLYKRMTGAKSPKEITLDEAIVIKQAENIENLTLSQQAARFGFKTAMKNNVMTWSFALGQLLNGVFSIFSAMAAAHQDEMAAQAAEEEKQSIQKLWKFVEDTKVNLTQTQQLFLDELHKKHQVAVQNQAFGLRYYENFLNSSINNIQDQISQALAQQQISMLTPDANGLRMADIGATWGLQTAYAYLYPSQGFISTTLGRPDFPYAQEIAQAPLTITLNSKSDRELSSNSSAAEKLWFNQKTITTIDQPADAPLDIEIKFRIIYKLTSAYHVGLYLGGKYQNYNSPEYLQKIKDQNRIDMDSAYLAKMFVLKRDDKDATPSVGLYENEGKGWIVQEPINNARLDTASIYHMSARLDKDQLTVSFWNEKNAAEKWSQTTRVNPCDQRTFGIIFSGLALEWNVVKPTLKIQENKKARSASNGQSEIDRQRASKATWKKLLQPQFGFMKLQSLGKIALLQGKYVYTTQGTNLVDEQNNPITDYVVYATADTQTNINNIGQSPQPSDSTKLKPNALVSLVTGNVYNSSQKIIARKDSMLQTYQQTNKLSQNIVDEIATMRTAYTAAQQANIATTTPQETVIASQTVSLADMTQAQAPVTGGMQIGLTDAAPSKIIATATTISQLQSVAAGTAQIEAGIDFTIAATAGLSL